MLTTSIAHKAILAGTKVLAGSILECLCDEALRADIRTSFAEEIGETVYQPMIPLGGQPSLRPHQALMERFRPLMREHYRTDRPIFENAF